MVTLRGHLTPAPQLGVVSCLLLWLKPPPPTPPAILKAHLLQEVQREATNSSELSHQQSSGFPASFIPRCFAPSSSSSCKRGLLQCALIAHFTPFLILIVILFAPFPSCHRFPLKRPNSRLIRTPVRHTSPWPYPPTSCLSVPWQANRVKLELIYRHPILTCCHGVLVKPQCLFGIQVSERMLRLYEWK